MSYCDCGNPGRQQKNGALAPWPLFSDSSGLGVRVEQIGCSKSLHVVVIVVIAYNVICSEHWFDHIMITALLHDQPYRVMSRFWLRATRWCPCFAFSGCLSVKFCQAVCWTSWCGAVHRVEMCDTIPNLSTISTPNKTLIWIHLDSFRSLSGLSGLNGLSLT